MDSFSFPSKKQEIILALGAESDGNFCLFINGKIHFSESFGDLLEEKNWQKYQKAVLEFIKKNDLQPDIVITDLHPLYLTSVWGEDLGKKYKAKYIQVQHHIAHIFSAIGENTILNTNCQIPKTTYGIAMDGTGYGEDEKIWGGEIFKIKNEKSKCKIIERIGHLENQTLIGGDLAIREPARMLISILDKFLSKNECYTFVKKYYTKNEFELIYNQLKQNFNCLETSSTGRILDTVSLLLGFCENERKYKHEPIALLEANSRKPYNDLKPKINLSPDKQILNTTFLFEYLVKNLHKDKKRLAATAQLYIAQGLYEIIKTHILDTRYKLPDTFFAGGIANNKIISGYLISQGAYPSKKIYPVKLPPGKLFSRVPRGDAGLSFGQIIYYLFSK